MNYNSESVEVIEVISNTRLVINLGSENGVNDGDQFLVYSLSEREIFDPDTYQPLGKFEFRKGVGKVTEVRDKVSVIEWKCSDEEDIRAFINPVVGDKVRRV